MSAADVVDMAKSMACMSATLRSLFHAPAAGVVVEAASADDDLVSLFACSGAPDGGGEAASTDDMAELMAMGCPAAPALFEPAPQSRRTRRPALEQVSEEKEKKAADCGEAASLDDMAELMAMSLGCAVPALPAVALLPDPAPKNVPRDVHQYSATDVRRNYAQCSSAGEHLGADFGQYFSPVLRHSKHSCTRRRLHARRPCAEPRAPLPADSGEVMANSNAHSCGGHGDPTTADQWMHATKDVIGEGATSVVYRCRFGGDGHYVAIKSPSSPAARRSATSPKACDEFRRSRRLHHNNVVGYLALGCQGNLVMEFIDGGSLADVIARSGALPEERVEQIAKHVLLGLAYMHENGIVHRDVKPANILVDTCTDTFKLCDWIVEEEASNCVNSVMGTPVFLAPEVVRSGRHCFSSDTWALGCTVLNIVTGTLPWSSEDNVFAAMFKTANGHAPPHPKDLSLPLRDLLALSFEPDATLRPAPDALLAIVLASHPDFAAHSLSLCM